MRVLFAGTPDIAIPSLTALIDAGHDVVGVLTRPDAKGKRGKQLHPSPVATAARDLGLAVLSPVSASDPDAIEAVRALDADIAAVVAYGHILKAPMLATTRHGWVNLHFSLLPAWRGAAPVQRSLMAGDDITGATTFLIDEGMDTGPVIGTLTETVRAADTAGDLLTRLATAGAPLLEQSCAAVVAGTAIPAAQSTDDVSHAAKLTREDARIRWDLPAHVIDRVIRGCTPGPGAWTTLPDGSVAKIGPVRQVRAASPAVPGQLALVDGDVLVGTGSDPVALDQIAPSGKRSMSAAQWWLGARLGDGAQLGES